MNDMHIKWVNTYWVVQRTFQTSPLTSRKCKTFTRQARHPPPHPPSLTPPSCEYIYCISITTPAMHMNAFCPYFLFNLQISCTFISFPQPFGVGGGDGVGGGASNFCATAFSQELGPPPRHRRRSRLRVRQSPALQQPLGSR